MEVEHPRFVKESRLPRDHAIHFHVSESECSQCPRATYLSLWWIQRQHDLSKWFAGRVVTGQHRPHHHSWRSSVDLSMIYQCARTWLEHDHCVREHEFMILFKINLHTLSWSRKKISAPNQTAWPAKREKCHIHVHIYHIYI